MGEIANFYIYWAIYFCLLMFAYLLLIKRKVYRLKQQYSVAFLFLAISCLLLIFANITSDYYNYQMILTDLEEYTFMPSIEPLYSMLAQSVDYQFYIFRLVVILPTFALLYLFFRYSLDITICIAIFIVVFSYSFGSVIRSSLADAIFWCGLLLLFRAKRAFLIGIVLVVLSSFCHKSMVLLLVPFIGAFLPLRMKNLKWIFLLTIIAIFIVRAMLPFLLERFGDDLIGESYLTNADSRGFTPFILSLVLNALLYSYFVALLYTLRFLLYSNNGMYRYLYKFLFISFCFFLFLYCQNISYYVYERFFAHLAMPICLLSSSFLLINKKVYSICILLMPVYLLFQNLYIYMFLQSVLKYNA